MVAALALPQEEACFGTNVVKLKLKAVDLDEHVLDEVMKVQNSDPEP